MKYNSKILLPKINGHVTYNYYPEMMERRKHHKKEQVEVMIVEARLEIPLLSPSLQTIFKEFAKCSPMDKFNLNVGRRIALGRALKQCITYLEENGIPIN